MPLVLQCCPVSRPHHGCASQGNLKDQLQAAEDAAMQAFGLHGELLVVWCCDCVSRGLADW